MCNGLDIHTHFKPEKLPACAERVRRYAGISWLKDPSGGCARLMQGEKFLREVDERLWNPIVCFDEPRFMEGFERRVLTLSPVPADFGYHLSPRDTALFVEFTNEAIASYVSAHPQYFVGLGMVTLNDPQQACEDLRHAVQTLGLCGVEIGTTCNEVDLNDPRFDEFWKEAEKLGAAIFVHAWGFPQEKRSQPNWATWEVEMLAETTLAMHKLAYSKLLIRFPRLRICFSHGGGFSAWAQSRFKRGLSARPDLHAEVTEEERVGFYTSCYWDAQLCDDPDALQFLVRKAGVRQVCCASDYPFPLGTDVPCEYVRQALSVEDAQRVLVDNPVEFLGLEHGQLLTLGLAS